MNDKLKLESLIRVIEDFDKILSKLDCETDYIEGQKFIIELLKAHI
ncbi:hypothetical protein UFOVP207_34 [uncultured Caudovirales phage]|uniref:Uncharacterized protein n=1 Tax=uncultured Caudovirales phage TaxID=2100421 RepID=A0A6J7WP23_9CAUD|nr:hypothetical protein UFOVP207_34 [uncultured Caudovirales phage]